MSLKKYPRRSKRESIFDKLPFIINRYPRLDPIEIFGEDTYKNNKELMHSTFEFLDHPEVVRRIRYSFKTYKFTCAYCGTIISDIGFNIDNTNKEHMKHCKHPFLLIKNHEHITTSFKKNNNELSLTFQSLLSKNSIVFTIKKAYIPMFEEYLKILRTDIRKVNKIDDINLGYVIEKNKEFFKTRLQKNEK